MKLIIGMLEKANKLPASEEKLQLLQIAYGALKQEISITTKELKKK